MSHIVDKIERIYYEKIAYRAKQRAKKRVPYFFCGNFRKKKKRRFTYLFVQ